MPALSRRNFPFAFAPTRNSLSTPVTFLNHKSARVSSTQACLRKAYASTIEDGGDSPIVVGHFCPVASSTVVRESCHNCARSEDRKNDACFHGYSNNWRKMWGYNCLNVLTSSGLTVVADGRIHLINGVGDRIVRLTGGSEGMLSSTILKDRIEGHKQRIVTQDHRRGCSQKFTKPDRVTQPNDDETRNRQVLIMCT